MFTVDTAANTLTFVTSITHPLLRNINDVLPIAASPPHFLVTNWLYYEPGTFAGFLDNALKRPNSYVVACSGNNCNVAVSGLKMANGIASSPDHKTVYVVESISKHVGVYHHDIAARKLTPVEYVPTVTLCDNIQRDPVQSDVFYTACHPKALTFLAHTLDHQHDAPSQVLRVTKGVDGKHTVSQLFYTDGHDMSASSGAVVVNVRRMPAISHHTHSSSPQGKLYVGAVHRDGVLVCDV